MCAPPHLTTSPPHHLTTCARLRCVLRVAWEGGGVPRVGVGEGGFLWVDALVDERRDLRRRALLGMDGWMEWNGDGGASRPLPAWASCAVLDLQVARGSMGERGVI